MASLRHISLRRPEQRILNILLIPITRNDPTIKDVNYLISNISTKMLNGTKCFEHSLNFNHTIKVTWMFNFSDMLQIVIDLIDLSKLVYLSEKLITIKNWWMDEILFYIFKWKTE